MLGIDDSEKYETYIEETQFGGKDMYINNFNMMCWVQ